MGLLDGLANTPPSLQAAPPKPTLFERVTEGPVVTDTGEGIAPTWSDYDNDGDIDLLVTHNRGKQNALYRNDGAAGFTRITSVPPVLDASEYIAAGWGDYDNDGMDDLFVTDIAFGTRIYRNLGGGTFSEPRDLVASSGAKSAFGGSWSDFDRDGRLDLLISYGGGRDQASEQLWRQNSDGSFTAVTTGPVVNSGGFSMGAAWGDFDDDLLPDLYVGNGWDEVGFFYHNLGNGEFAAITTPPFNAQSASSSAVAWADYDNDGDLDLFVGHAAGNHSALYRNLGKGQFVKVIDSALVQGATSVVGAMWGDFDNDGWLDLYVANRGQRNNLFRNLGDGSFEPVTDDLPVLDVKASNGCAWGDYDNDGFLDLAVANWDGQSTDLFHNRGNSNAWLKIRCRGTASNASGIGAKVRVLARLGGVPTWQMREINTGDGWGGPELIAHFGLGDASTVERMVVEWPSGTIQEVRDISPRRNLTLTEPAPQAQPLVIAPNGGIFTNSVTVTLRSGVTEAAIRYTIDGSEPGADDTFYSGPFTLTKTTTVKARLFLNGFPASETLSAHYQADPGVYLVPSGGDFTNSVVVTLTTRLPQVLLHYSQDGFDPTTASPVFTDPLTVTSNLTVKVVAYFNDFPVSEVVSGAFRRVYIFQDDGISNAWRENYFGPDFRYDPRAHQSSDPDRDGSDNRQEFLAGTDPLDAASGFRIGYRALPEIRFPTVPGLTYRILRRHSLTDPTATVLLESAATGDSMRFIDESPDASPNPSFYLVEPVR